MCVAPQPNVLCAATVCNFSSLTSPDGSAPAALASLLFDPPEPQIIGKTQSESQLCYLFAHLHLPFSDSFSSLIFSLLLFSSLTLPTSAFPSVHIVGSLTLKLPSTTTLHYTNFNTLHYTTLHYTKPHYTNYYYIYNYNYVTLHHTTPHTKPHYTNYYYIYNYNYVALHCTRLHNTTPHYITLHSLHNHKCSCPVGGINWHDQGLLNMVISNSHPWPSEEWWAITTTSSLARLLAWVWQRCASFAQHLGPFGIHWRSQGHHHCGPRMSFRYLDGIYMSHVMYLCTHSHTHRHIHIYI